MKKDYQLTIAITLLLISHIAFTLVPLSISTMIDEAINTGVDIGLVIFISCLIVFFCFVKVIADIKFNNSIKNYIFNEYSSKFVDIIRKPRGMFEKHQLGELIDVYSKYVNSYERYLSSLLTATLPAIFIYFGMMATSFYLSVELTLILLFFQFIYTCNSIFMLPKIKKKSMELQSCHYSLTDSWIESLGMNREIQQFDSLDFNMIDINNNLSSMTNHWADKNIISGIYNTFNSTLPLLSSLVIIPFVVSFISAGTTTWGEAIAIFTINSIVFSQGSHIANSLQAYFEYTAVKNDFDLIINSETYVTTPNKKVLQYNLEITPHILKYGSKSGLTLESALKINYGEKVAILGKSGAGKSTLFKHFEHADTDNRKYLFIDKVNADEISTKEFNGIVNVCFQDNNLLSGVERWVQKSIKHAEYKNLLTSLELPKDIASGERFLQPYNGNISGGEAKRLSIARSIISHGYINLFDEPTTGLNPKLSKSVWDLIFKSLDDKTIICSTHDMSVIDRFDRVIILEDGKVVSDITPSQLLSDEHFLKINGNEVSEINFK
ncbi:MAG: ATP-binding cassette domain-containing protein [Vibrio sp.]